MRLDGRRVLVTRAAHQAEALATLLRARGADPLLWPCIAIRPLDDFSALDAALHAAARGEFDWLLFTSPNGVTAIEERTKSLGTTTCRLSLAAVGTATARALHDSTLAGAKRQPVCELARDPAEIVATMCIRPGTRVLLPQSDLAAMDIRLTLETAGAQVHAVSAFHTVTGEGGVELVALLRVKSVDAVLFTSASAARNSMTRLKNGGGEGLLPRFLDLPCVCIGPKTAYAARGIGMRRVYFASEHGLKALVDTLSRILDGKKPRP